MFIAEQHFNVPQTIIQAIQPHRNIALKYSSNDTELSSFSGEIRTRHLTSIRIELIPSIEIMLDIYRFAPAQQKKHRNSSETEPCVWCNVPH